MKVKFSIRDFENGDVTDFVLEPNDEGKIIGDHRLELLNIEFIGDESNQLEPPVNLQGADNEK